MRVDKIVHFKGIPDDGSSNKRPCFAVERASSLLSVNKQIFVEVWHTISFSNDHIVRWLTFSVSRAARSFTESRSP